WILGILTVGPPVIGLLIGPQGGMFGGLVVALFVGLGALFNLPSLIANIFYARRRRWAVIWLNLVLLLQGVAAAGTLWFVGSVFVKDYLQTRAYRRVGEVYAAVRANDPAVVQRALDDCAADCAGLSDYLLLEATAEGAHRSMEYLLSRGANPTPPA